MPDRALIDHGDVWASTDVRVEDVLDALERLRRHGRHGIVRTSVLTLVVVLAADVDADAVFDTVHRLGGRHPSRTILCRLADGPAGIDARVGVHDLERRGDRLALDDVLLDVRGPAGDHLDSIVAPLVLPDLPVVLWLHDGLAPADDPRLNRASHVLVDTDRAGGPSALPAVAGIARRLPVNDLAWVRLLPLREHLAGLLRAPHCRPYLEGISAAEVRGGPLQQALLGGWLDDRLGGVARRVDADDHTAVVIEAAVDGRRARFEASTDGMGLRALAEVDGAPVTDLLLPCPPADDATVLGRALVHLRRDRVYEAAIRRA